MKKLFAIFGNPVSHSKSPLMHNLAFDGLGYEGCYTRYRLEDGDMLAEKFFSLGLSGANITVPHKESAFRACDHLDPFALKVGAVNTIVERDGKLHGYNTDAPGFLRVVEEMGEYEKILLVGAGGTAQSTAVILEEMGYDVSILNRGAKRLEWFDERGFDTSVWDDYRPDARELIVNMTSAGLTDDTLPAPEEILSSLFEEADAVIDIVYGRETPFLKMAKSYGLKSADGSDMLLYQGILAFGHFTGEMYTFDEISRYMRRAFYI